MTTTTTPAPHVLASRPDNVLRLRDGRLLGYGEYGDRAGVPFVLFHGWPGSRLCGAGCHDAATQRGVRVIAPDRPGYGLSDFKEKRTIADWTDDVAELADALGLGRFAIAGISGGGPYAAACALRIPDRLTFAGIISGLGPFDAPAATEGMNPMIRMLYGAARRVPPVARALLEMMSYVGKSEWALNQMLKNVREEDRAVLSDERARAFFMDDFKEAFRQGARGALQEAGLYTRPWGFRLQDIVMPVTLWQGTKDVNVPVSMGRHQAQAIPHCDARFFEGEGHLLGFAHMNELLDAVAAAPRA